MRKFNLAAHVGAAALIAGAMPAMAAGGARAQEEFEVSQIFFETNATAGDVGIHMFVDGEDWDELSVIDPTGKTITKIKANGGAGVLGLTELFIESSEPELSELSFAEHVELFPPGEYAFEGKTIDHTFKTGDDELTTDIPCPVTISNPSEGEELDIDDVTVEWSHNAGTYDPDTDTCAGDDVDLIGFHVTVVFEYEDGDEEIARDYEADVGPGVTELPVPEGFLQEGVDNDADFKIEVLSIEESGNRTINERAFEVSD